MVSDPHFIAHSIFSISCGMDDAIELLPILVLIFTRKFLPIAIGSSSGWLTFAGIIALPRATSPRTNSGVISNPLPNHVPACWILRLERGASGDIAPSTPLWSARFSRRATYSISGVIIPFFA